MDHDRDEGVEDLFHLRLVGVGRLRTRVAENQVALVIGVDVVALVLSHRRCRPDGCGDEARGRCE